MTELKWNCCWNWNRRAHVALYYCFEMNECPKLPPPEICRSNKNNCNNNHRVNCSTLQDDDGNKGLGMTLFTSADCFKKRRESRASLSASVSAERKGKREGREGWNIKGIGHYRGMKGDKDSFSSAGRRRCAERAPIAYWPGLKSILEAIVCNSDVKAAR